jgi:hypothetical protein
MLRKTQPYSVKLGEACREGSSMSCVAPVAQAAQLVRELLLKRDYPMADFEPTFR